MSKRYKLNSMLSPEIPLIIGTYDECVAKQSEYGMSGAMLTKISESKICECKECRGYVVHSSDCAVHNEPAMKNGKCDCGINAT